MRFPVRAVGLAMSTITIICSGVVAVSVSASALESDGAEQSGTTVVAPAVDVAVDPAVDAAFVTELKTYYLTVAQGRISRGEAVALATAQRRAEEVRVQKVRARVLTVAKNQIGDRYSAGATGPSAFDCSGFTRYVYKVAAGKELPHYSVAQYSQVKKISREQARPGDLIFFLRNGAHHVGIYLGEGRMVDAAGYGKGVRISPISGSWWSRSFTGFGRLLPA